MSPIAKLSALTVALILAGCAAKQPAADPQPSAPVAAKPAAATGAAKTAGSKSAKQGDTRIVKSQNGKFDGEIVGTPAKNSKFAKVKIGMTLAEVNNLIGAPDNLSNHETGKRWIPFYYGNDVQRMQVMYKSEGCLTYTGGNHFGGGGNELIRIEVDPKGACFQ